MTRIALAPYKWALAALVSKLLHQVISLGHFQSNNSLDIWYTTESMLILVLKFLAKNCLGVFFYEVLRELEVLKTFVTFQLNLDLDTIEVYKGDYQKLERKN